MSYMTAALRFLFFSPLVDMCLHIEHQQENGSRILASTAIKKIPELMIPALGSIILAYILLKLGLMFNGEAAKQIGSVWLGYFYRFEADFAVALKQGVFGAIFISETSYNSSLWTISIKFYRSPPYHF